MEEETRAELLWNLNKAIRVCGDMQKVVLSSHTQPEIVRQYAAATILRCSEMLAGIAVEFKFRHPDHTSEEIEELIDLASKVDWA
jgi:hypothetical protein